MKTIEKLRKEDHDQIITVWEASVRATHYFLSEDDVQFFKPLIREQYLDAVELYGIREDEGRVIAFLGTSEEMVEMLFVDPAYSGKGIGKTLMQFAIQELGKRKVDVNEQNEGAVGFYHHLGFRTVSRSPVDGLGKPFPILHLEMR